MDNLSTCAKTKRCKAVCDRGTPAGFPQPSVGSPSPLNVGLRPKQITKRGTCRACFINRSAPAWSKRLVRQTGRHGRKRPPLRGAKTGTNRTRTTSSPARSARLVYAPCPNHLRKCKAPKTGLSKRGPGLGSKRATKPTVRSLGSLARCRSYLGCRQRFAWLYGPLASLLCALCPLIP